MKELVFSMNSWHYKLASWAGYSGTDHGEEICAYTRRVLLGFLLIGLILLVAYALTFVVIDLGFGLVFSIMVGEWITGFAGTAGLIIIVAATFVGTLTWGIETWKQKMYEREQLLKKQPPRPDGFVKHAYKSWKEKYCAKIKFVGRDQ